MPLAPLTDNNIESELSYAYLHAVASHAGCSCEVAGRHEDNTGIDAKLVGWGPFPSGGFRNEVDLKIQLKATVSAPGDAGNFWSYSLRGIPRYDDLRTHAVSTPRILVVLFLPSSAKTSWISHTTDALSLHRCAYWASLRGAQPSANDTSQTVYLPKAQKFDVPGLLALLDQVSLGNIPAYSEPAP